MTLSRSRLKGTFFRGAALLKGAWVMGRRGGRIAGHPCVLQNPWFYPTASAGRSFSPSGAVAHSVAPPPPPQKRTCYQHRRREKCAEFGDGDRSAGDPFATGCENGGSGVEPGAGAAEEGDVRGRKGSPKKPLEMTSRSVSPPVSVVPVLVAPDPFQMGSGRYRPTPYGRFF